MSTVDNRVVEMQFDDTDFTPGIKKAIDALDKLQQALKLDASKSGLSAISSNTVAVSGAFDGLQYAVAKTSNSFSTMEAVALMALNNIVNRAVDAGARIAKSLTIDQATQGFGEYELKMNSIQTILASSPEKTLEDVNRLLDELNAYADKTIYSFSDMTANIGKFTNAGVKLDVAVDAIQGISNLAALSGANANEASRAMYNFAQALSAGYVKLIDWKSIENANMATVEFKNQLLETALALGTVRKEGEMYVTTTTNAQGKISDAFDATHNFNDALAHQWMTTDVLTTTLAKYVDETTEIGKRAAKAATEVRTWTILVDSLKEAIGSGWAKTFELIFGDYHEATAFWTGLSEAITSVIEPIGDFRNGMLQVWRDSSKWGVSGRDQLLAGISNRVKFYTEAFTPIIQAFGEAFGISVESAGQALADFVYGFHKWGRVLSRVKVDTENLFGAFYGFFNNFSRVGGPVADALGRIANGFWYVFHNIDQVSVLRSINSWLRDLSSALTLSDDNLQDIGASSINIAFAVRDALASVGNIIRFIAQLIAPVVDAFLEVAGVNRVLTNSAEGIRTIIRDFRALTETLTVSSDTAGQIKDAFKTAFQAIHDVGSFVASVFASLYGYARKIIPVIANKLSPVMAFLGRVIKTVIAVVLGLVGGLAALVAQFDLRKIVDKFVSSIRSAKEWFVRLYETIMENESVKRFVELIGQARDYISNLIETVKETGSLDAFSTAIDDMAAAFKNLQNESGLVGDIARGIQSAINTISEAIARIKKKASEIKALFDELGITEGFEKILKGIKELKPSEIAEGFTQLGEGVSTLMTEYVIPAFVSGLDSAVQSANEFLTSPDGLQSILNTVKSFFSIEKLKSAFSDVGENFGEMTLFNGVTDLANNLVSGFLSVFGVPEEIANDALTNFWWFMSGFADPWAHFASTFNTQVSGAFTEMSEVLGDSSRSLMDNFAADLIDNPVEGLWNILNLVRSGELVALTASLITLTNNLSGLFGAIKSVPTKFSKALADFGKMFKGLGRAFTGLAVLEIAASIYIIAKAMQVLAEIPPESMQQALNTLLIIMAAIGVFILLMANLQNGMKDLTKGEEPVDIFKNLAQGFSEGLKGLNSAGLGLGVLAIAGAIVLLVYSIKRIAELLDTVDPKTLAISAGAIVVVLGLFAIIIKSISDLGNGGSIFGAGLGILAMAFALKLIVSAMSEVIGLMGDPNFFAAAAVVVGIITLLGVIMLALSNMTSIFSGGLGTFVGIGVSMILLALSLQLVIDAIAKLAEIINDPAVTVAGYAIGAFLAEIGIIIALIAAALPAFSSGFGLFAGIGVAFVLLAASLLIVVEALKALIPLTSNEGFWTGIGAISMLMLALAASVGILAVAAGLFQPKLGSIIALGVSMVLLGLAMAVIAQGIAAIAEATPDSDLVATIADKIGQLLIVMALILSLAGSMGSSFAGNALMFSASMLLMSLGITLLAGAISQLAELPADNLQASLDAITKALVLFLISAGIVAAIPPMEAALLILGTALLEAGAGVKLFGEGAVDIADAMLKIQRIKSDSFDGVINGLKKFLDTFTLWDANKAKELADGLGPLIDTIDRLSALVTTLKEAGVYSTASALKTLLTAMDSYKGNGNLEEFVAFMEAVSEHQEAMSTFSTYMDSSTTMVSKMGDVIPKLVESETLFIDTESNFVTALNNVADSLLNFKDKSTGVSAVMGDLSTSMGNLVAVMAGIIEKNADQISPAGGALVEALARGMEDEIASASDRMSRVVDYIRMGADNTEVELRYENLGKRLIAALMRGIESQNGQTKDQGKVTANQAVTGADEMSNKFYGVGTNMIRGLINGLNDGSWGAQLYAAAYNMALRAKRGAEAAVDVNSPSRVFMRIGEYITEGLAIGITDSGGLAEKAAYSMVKAVSNVAQDAIDDINASKYDIYLTPVIDDQQLSALTTGVSLNGVNFSSINGTLAALNQNGTNTDLLYELQKVHRDLVEIASRPSIQTGDINATLNDEQEVLNLTRGYITRLATLKGGM